MHALTSSLRASMLWLLATSTISTFASPLLNHEIEDLTYTITEPTLEQSLLRRQSSSGYTPITGITGFGTPPRLEIRQLQKNVDQWNLYILALDRFMKTNETGKLSYYQIAGIHGRPYIPWDNVGPFPGNTQGPGYCTHMSNIFLPWHRPYLALYEQVLFGHMVDVVNSFPSGSSRARYAQAAVSWRHPYWDWAAPPPQGESVFPSALTTRTINVTLPNGTANIANPLFAFDFHPVSVADFYYNPFASWPDTKRYPTSWSQDATSQNNLVAAMLDNNRQSFQQRIYNLFTNYDNFTEFGNEAWYYGNKPSSADSVESLHDVIHAITGQNGHMTYLDYSAFDPLFWLHHVMIDRLYAMFQALHPDSYVEPMRAIQQTFTIQNNQTVDINTPLDPFHTNTNGDKHNSQTVRDTAKFGYSYSDAAGNASAVKAAINNLYGTSAGSKVLNKRSTDLLTECATGYTKRALESLDLAALPGETTEEGKKKEYILNIQSEKFAANGSYAIYVFLGYYNEDDPSCWPLAPNLVGTHGVFTALPNDPAGSGLGERPPMANVLVTGTIPLTSMLIAKVQNGELASMKDDVVETYLANNLKWRAATLDNTAIPVSEVKGLDVTVVRSEVQPATSHDTFPTWGDFVQLKHLTSRSESCPA